MFSSQSELEPHAVNTPRFFARYILALSYAMLGCCVSPSFLARTSHVNVSATGLALVCVDPEDPDETRRECLLRRLNRCMKLAEDMGLAVGNLQPALSDKSFGRIFQERACPLVDSSTS